VTFLFVVLLEREGRFNYWRKREGGVSDVLNVRGKDILNVLTNRIGEQSLSDTSPRKRGGGIKELHRRGEMSIKGDMYRRLLWGGGKSGGRNPWQPG